MTSYEKFIYYLKWLVHNCNHFLIVVRKHKSFFFFFCAQVGDIFLFSFFFFNILSKLTSICIFLIDERNKFYSNQYQAKQKFAYGISERRFLRTLVWSCNFTSSFYGT